MTQNQNNSQLRVSTQIRNFYSDGVAYMNTKFYNTSFMITLYPFSGRDQNGRSKYNMESYVSCTIAAEGAYALYQVGLDIINGKVSEVAISIPCFNGEIRLERKASQNGFDTVLTVNKNGTVINFVFSTLQYSATENGVNVVKVSETGLGSFVKTLEGFLSGINADRHLDKLTEEYVKLMNGNNEQSNSNTNNSQPNKPRWNNNGQKNYYNNNQNNSQQRRYNNQSRQQYNQPKQNNWGGSSQGFDNYNVPG